MRWTSRCSNAVDEPSQRDVATSGVQPMGNIKTLQAVGIRLNLNYCNSSLPIQELGYAGFSSHFFFAPKRNEVKLDLFCLLEQNKRINFLPFFALVISLRFFYFALLCSYIFFISLQFFCFHFKGRLNKYMLFLLKGLSHENEIVYWWYEWIKHI
jgi:hypothetical protein